MAAYSISSSSSVAENGFSSIFSAEHPRISGVQFCAKTLGSAAAVHWLFGCSSLWLPNVDIIHKKNKLHVEFV